MTNTDLLMEYIQQSGYKIYHIASTLGLTSYGFMRKVHNKSDFKVPEMRALCALLSISDGDREKIFFTEEVDE